MTGYGYQEKQDLEGSLSAEIKGYNSRFLEITVNLPPQLSALELDMRRYLAARCRRGKIELTVHLKEHDQSLSVSVNRAAVKAYQEAIETVAAALNMTPQIDLALVLGLEGVLEIEKSQNTEEPWTQVEPLLEAAFDQFDQDRDREGKHTEADILSHVAVIESAVKTVAPYAPTMEASIRENLRSRFLELLEGTGQAGSKIIDENRILAETAILLMKCTISEEISRLSAHLGEFRAETLRNPSPGKKLDFLCQEINREINTIGSKSPILEVSRAVVDMKNALENIREQLRNVE